MIPKPRRPRDPEGRMTLIEHLYELRNRVAKSLIALVLAGIVAFVFFHPIFRLITRPYCGLPVAHRLGGGHCDLIVTGVLDPFSVRLKISMYAGFVFASPVWLWQLWRFVTPGLHRHERRWALSFVGCSLGLFALGGAFAYLTLSNGLRFLLGMGGGTLTPLIRADSYLSFAVAMVLIFGVSFEFPLFVAMLNLAGLVSYERLRSWRRAEIFGVFVFAAVATPSQDPFTMTAMAVPMCLLYEVALIVARVHERRAGRRSSELDYSGLSDDQPSPLPVQPA